MRNCPVESVEFDDEFDGQNFSSENSQQLNNRPHLFVARGATQPVPVSQRKPGHAANVTAHSLNHDSPRRPGGGVWVPIEMIEDYVEDWLGDGEYHGQSPLTLRGKRGAIEKLLWFLRRSNAGRCGALEVKKFISHCKNGHLEPEGRWGGNDARSRQPVGERSMQLYFIYVKGYFNWLASEGLINLNPLANVKQPRCAKPQIKPFTIDEVAALLAVVRKSHHRLRNEAIIYLMLDSGLRVAELCSIRSGDIDIARGTLSVVGKGKKKRDVWFGRDTAKVLKDYLEKHKRESGDAFFYSERPGAFDDGITPDGVRRLLQRLGKFAGLTEKRVSPHTFRHTFATEFIKAGGAPKALQMMLGHEDMEMTYRYVSLSESDAAAQHRLHSPARLLRAKVWEQKGQGKGK